jgi:DeoR/GlpR family transcriptional regulator of sugar metabolism
MLRPVERRQQILKDIGEVDDNLIPELSRKYDVSEMTIRRDLKALEDKGLIKRTWGGAILWPPHRNEPFVMNRERRLHLHVACKEAIARHAASRWVQDGDIVILEGGTTVTAMVRYLQPYKELTVVTNGLHTAERLQRYLPADATIICSGGILRPESSTFVGPVAEQCFREFHGRRLFLSGTGFTPEMGLTDPRMLETQVKRAMIACADEVVVLLDSSKFGVKSLMTVLGVEDIACLIVDDGAPADMLKQLGARGVQVATVRPG